MYIIVDVPPITGGCYAIKKREGPSGVRRVASTQIKKYVPPKAPPRSTQPAPIKPLPPLPAPNYVHLEYKVLLPGPLGVVSPSDTVRPEKAPTLAVPLRRSTRDRKPPRTIDL